MASLQFENLPSQLSTFHSFDNYSINRSKRTIRFYKLNGRFFRTRTQKFTHFWMKLVIHERTVRLTFGSARIVSTKLFCIQLNIFFGTRSKAVGGQLVGGCRWCQRNSSDSSTKIKIQVYDNASLSRIPCDLPCIFWLYFVHWRQKI